MQENKSSVLGILYYKVKNKYNGSILIDILFNCLIQFLANHFGVNLRNDWGGENKMDNFFPAFIATRAVKLKH